MNHKHTKSYQMNDLVLSGINFTRCDNIKWENTKEGNIKNIDKIHHKNNDIVKKHHNYDKDIVIEQNIIKNVKNNLINNKDDDDDHDNNDNDDDNDDDDDDDDDNIDNNDHDNNDHDNNDNDDEVKINTVKEKKHEKNVINIKEKKEIIIKNKTKNTENGNIKSNKKSKSVNNLIKTKSENKNLKIKCHKNQNKIETTKITDKTETTEIPETKDTDDSNETKEINEVNKPPVYDGIEPYYIFRRKWEAYIQGKQNKKLHTSILLFLNQLFGTKYNSLVEMKKISFDMIPPSKKFLELITENAEYDNIFKINQNKNIPTSKLIDSLLNRLNFSFVKINNDKQAYYSVKTYRISQPKNSL